MSDEFDFMARKVTGCMIDVLQIMDGYPEPGRSIAITAIEELYFRITNGKHLDFEQLKEESLNELTRQMEEAMAAGPATKVYSSHDELLDELREGPPEPAQSGTTRTHTGPWGPAPKEKL